MNNIIYGKNAVAESLRAGVCIDKLFVDKDKADAATHKIIMQAREAGVPVIEAGRRKLDEICIENGIEGKAVHQGIVAAAAQAEYCTIDDILKYAGHKNQQPFVMICNEISDPHNLGAIIRTCEAAGAHGVIVPKRRSAGLGPVTAKASSGAVFHTRIARVTNISTAIRELKTKGLWVYAASADGDMPLWKADFKEACAVVIGSEGKGVGRLVSENSDYILNIPMDGRVSSLNASVSAAVILYEAFRQRRQNLSLQHAYN